MKTFYRSIVILTFAFLGLNQSAKATHVAGVDFSYTCVGQDSFLITFNAFRDCSGATMGSTAPVTFTSTCGGSVSASLTLQNGSTGTEVSQLCPTSITSSTCNGGSLPGMQQYIYSGIVVLSPPCNTWTMAWSLCCRNTAVNLVGQANMYITATLNSGVDACNNSPQFNAQPIPYVCLNQVVNYNFGVTEPDGDSIVYSFVSPMISATNPVTFQAGYTFTQPVPGVTLNTATGQLTFTPTILGNFVLAVQACEYEYGTGVLKGCITRDIQFVVINCSNQQPAAPPTGISNFSGTGVQVAPDSVEVCVGNNFSFDLVFTDADVNDSVTLFSNITTVLPGATITSVFGNPATVTVSWTAQPGSAPFNTFTVTGVDDACPTPGIATASYNVIVVPSTYAGPDVTICQGTQWAQMAAVGGSLFSWTLLSGSPIDTVPTSPGYNMTCQNCQFPQISPAVTSTYIVTSNLSGTCVNVDTVTISVAPNFDLIMPPDTLICSIDSVPLPVNTTQPTFSYSYNWNNSGTLNNDTISNPTALPTVSTTYGVTVSSSGGCVKSDQVTVDLSPPFPPNITIVGDTVICLGDSTGLAVSLGDVSSSTCGLATSPCMGLVSTGTIGTGTATNTSTGYPAPYNNFYWGAKHQILYTAAEMQAMGMLTGGKITSIAFEITQLGNLSVFNNYEVKMGCTSSTDLTGGWESGLVTVLPSYAHTVTLGWNTHTFTTPYDWDGVSNIVIQICHNNSSYSSAGTSFSPYTVTANQSVRYYRADNSSVCSSTSAGTLSNSRPNIQFEYCTGADPAGFTYSWSPNLFINNTTVIDPTVFPPVNTTYSVYVADTFGGCVDTVLHEVQVVTNYNAGFQFNDPLCVDANPDTAQPYVAGGVYSGIGIIDTLGGVFNPGTAGVGTWPVTYTVSSPTGGCTSDSTINVVVINLPDATIAPFEICVGSAPDTLSAATPGGTWSGLGISDPVNGIFDPLNLNPGFYDVVYTLTQPCVSADTLTVKVIKPYTFNFVSPIISLCQDDTVNLSNNYVLTTDPLQGNGPVVPTWSDVNGAVGSLSGIFDATGLPEGDYVVTLEVAGINGECGSVKTMIVRVNKIDYPEFPSSLVFCSDVTKAIVQVDPWLFGNGTSYTQTPISPLGVNDTLDLVPFGPNGKFDATESGLGSWEIEVTYTNLNGCTGVSKDTIYVLDTPATPTPKDATYCEGDDIYLNATGATADSMYWYSDAALTDTIGVGSPSYWGVAPDPASGPITVYVTENNWECISPSASFVLPIKEAPVAEFEMNFTDTLGVQQLNVPHTQSPIYGYTLFDVDFNALNIGPTDSVNWNHHAEITPPSPEWVNTENPVRFGYAVSNFDPNNPLASDAYITELIVTNEFGCMDTAQTLIWSVASSNVYNVFTPNGDGVNDIFILPVYGMRTYHAEIYNRWGRKVYEWDNPKDGWSGDDQPDGVYYYVIIGERGDGSEYKQQGSVTLTGSGK